MTIKEQKKYIDAASKALKEKGIKVFKKDMILLETGCGHVFREIDPDSDLVLPDYVMFRDAKSNREYQCFFNVNNYTVGHESFWYVSRYC